MLSTMPERKMVNQLPPIPAPMRAAMEQNKVYIYNVGPKSWPRPMGSLGMFFIPACPEGAEVSPAVQYQGRAGLPSIIPESVVKSVEGTQVEQTWSFDTEGARLAKDIVGFGAFHSEHDDLRPFGVFIAKGETPTQDELDEARSRLFARYDALVRDADQKFQVNGGMEVGDDGRSYPGITADHVEAVKALGLDRPWAKVNRKLEPCPACERPIPAKAIRCTHAECGAILDEEKARKFFPQLYAHENEAKRTRKAEAA